MARQKLTVYLDHHIKRDSLFYKRPTVAGGELPATRDFLNIKQLYGDNAEDYLLRKPDFQRATWSWSPEECVELLEAVLSEQVVPSVIMWLGADGTKFVLDGGHRISVLLAWIKDDWGDRLPANHFKDDALEMAADAAANRVRELLHAKDIGAFKDYSQAEREYREWQAQDQVPASMMDMRSFEFAKKARRWASVETGFPVLWVKGDYKTAEQSFLKINKTGRVLSKWETKLVENRNSSLARAVMSIAEVQQANRFWPIDDEEVRLDTVLSEKAVNIIQLVKDLNDLLFDPVYETPIKQPIQPLVATPFTKPETRAAYVAEILTITEGLKGQPAETERLIKKDTGAPPSLLINNGLTLLKHAKDDLSNVYGLSPKSVLLMPLVYFYNDQGRYVRSLLYGMLFWMNSGSPNKDIHNRKLLFSAHRSAFETVLLEHKEEIIKRITRRIGSGSEVTYPTARYLQGLLKLLIRHNDDITSDEFKSEHKDLIKNLNERNLRTAPQTLESSSRLFTPTQKAIVNVKEFVDMFPKCQICGGRYHPGLFTQMDHKKDHSKGGATSVSNARNTHPFCNNNKIKIEQLRAGTLSVELSAFDDKEDWPQQMSFLDFFDSVTSTAEDSSDVTDEDDDENLDAEDEQDS